MTRDNMTQTVNWLGTSYQVKITWETEGDEVTFIRGQINGKEMVRYIHGRWKDAKGNKQEASEYQRLKKCCQEKFRFPRYTLQAITPMFTLLLGEQM
nr:hypothetical protein [uncultured Desulfuromonas sp.]